MARRSTPTEGETVGCTIIGVLDHRDTVLPGKCGRPCLVTRGDSVHNDLRMADGWRYERHWPEGTCQPRVRDEAGCSPRRE